MGKGRPPLGPKLIESINAPSIAKERARVILETIAGSIGVAEACAKLGVSDTQFHALRQEALTGLVDALAPRPRGRPPAVVDEKDARIAELEQAKLALEANLKAEALRSEIATTMPHVLQRKAERSAQKKGARYRASRRKP